jgi:hypothetical protein
MTELQKIEQRIEKLEAETMQLVIRAYRLKESHPKIYQEMLETQKELKKLRRIINMIK